MTDVQDSGNVVAPEQTIDQVQPPKMLSEEQVNKIVRERVADVQKKADKRVSDLQSQFTTQNQGMGGMSSGPSQEEIQRMIDEGVNQRLDQRVQEAMAQKTYSEYHAKIQAAKDKYPDIEERLAKLNLSQVPQLVIWANSLDNTVETLKEMADNPARFGNVLTLAAISPAMAQAELANLSKSISVNESAKNIPVPPEPLSQIKPSTIGSDSGEWTTKDKDAFFRKRYRG